MFRRIQSSENSPEIPLAAVSYPRDQPFSHCCGVVIHIRSSPRGFANRLRLSGINDVDGGQTGDDRVDFDVLNLSTQSEDAPRHENIGKLRRNAVLYRRTRCKSTRASVFWSFKLIAPRHIRAAQPNPRVDQTRERKKPSPCISDLFTTFAPFIANHTSLAFQH
jgi:hypothetical protein